MNKKFYQINKLNGVTSIYFLAKSKDLNENKKFQVDADDYLCLNNTSLDYVTNKYIFYAKEIIAVKTEKYVLELTLRDEPNSFRKIIPIPLRSVFKGKYDSFIEKLDEDFKDCYYEIIQFYKYS